MKKLIALLIAVSTLTMATSTFAAYDAFDLAPIGANVDDHTGASRNYAISSEDDNGQYNYGSPVFRSTDAAKEILPTYRNGDKITFQLTPTSNGVPTPVSEGDVLTFICSKQSDTDYDNYNVQMVDQIELSPADGSSYVYCTYKLRDNLEDGRYKLEMNLNGITNTFSFLIGTPSVELLYVNNVSEKAVEEITKADKYFLRNGDAYCFGKATITGGANFTQTNTEFGFEFENGMTFTKGTARSGKNVQGFAQEVADSSMANNNSEINGTGAYFFRMVIEDVYPYTGTEPTADEAAEIYDKLYDVDVFLNN